MGVVEHIPQILVLMIVMFAISCVLHTLRTGGYHPQSSNAKPSASRRMLASTEPKNDGGDPFPKMGYLLIFGMLLLLVPIVAVLLCGDTGYCWTFCSTEMVSENRPLDGEKKQKGSEDRERHAQNSRSRCMISDGKPSSNGLLDTIDSSSSARDRHSKAARGGRHSTCPSMASDSGCV